MYVCVYVSLSCITELTYIKKYTIYAQTQYTDTTHTVKRKRQKDKEARERKWIEGPYCPVLLYCYSYPSNSRDKNWNLDDVILSKTSIKKQGYYHTGGIVRILIIVKVISFIFCNIYIYNIYI